MLGMAWGIATVVLLLAYGNGFGEACANIFANFGTKTMILIPGRTSMQAGGEKAGAKLRFTMEDVDLLTTNVPQITRISPDASKDSSIQYDTRTFNFNVSGGYPMLRGSGFGVGARPLLVQVNTRARCRNRIRSAGETLLRTQRPG
jgi:putative ABC transport system permease protein